MPVPTGTVGPVQLAPMLGPWRSAGGGRSKPLQTVLAERVSSLILDGRLALGARLPAERSLSEALGVSRTTVSAAYAQLRESGFAVSRQGSGSYTALPGHVSARAGGGWDAGRGEMPDVIDLMTAAPTAPLPELREAVHRAADLLPEFGGSGGYQPYGLTRLREAVADRYSRRGLPTSPGQILITNGAQGAITLVARLLCRAGDRILVEGPTYPNALDTFRAAQARPIPVPMDVDGWAPRAYENALAQLTPRLAYLIPHFQSPTGHLMDPARQAAVAHAARRAGSWLLADETITDVALDVPVPPPFAAGIRPADAEAVLVCGSMAKSFWGGLRIGWLRGPERIVHELAAARAAMDLASPILDQLTAALLLDRADAHASWQRERLREQRAALMQAVDRTFPAWTYRVPEGGLCLWLRMDKEEATSLSRRAQTHGVLVHSGPRFGADAGTFERFIRLPYSLPSHSLLEAVRRLALARESRGPRPAADHRDDLVA